MTTFTPFSSSDFHHVSRYSVMATSLTPQSTMSSANILDYGISFLVPSVSTSTNMRNMYGLNAYLRCSPHPGWSCRFRLLHCAPLFGHIMYMNCTSCAPTCTSPPSVLDCKLSLSRWPVPVALLRTPLLLRYSIVSSLSLSRWPVPVALLRAPLVLRFSIVSSLSRWPVPVALLRTPLLLRHSIVSSLSL